MMYKRVDFAENYFLSDYAKQVRGTVASGAIGTYHHSSQITNRENQVYLNFIRLQSYCFPPTLLLDA